MKSPKVIKLNNTVHNLYYVVYKIYLMLNDLVNKISVIKHNVLGPII